MFTVKVRDPDGTEAIYAAKTIDVVHPRIYTAEDQTKDPAQTAGASNIYECGIFLDREPAPQVPGAAMTRFSQHIIQFGHDATLAGQERKGGKVWVMNEAGATVASYDL